MVPMIGRTDRAAASRGASPANYCTCLTGEPLCHYCERRRDEARLADARAREIINRGRVNRSCNCGRTVSYKEAMTHLGAPCRHCGGDNPRVAGMSDREHKMIRERHAVRNWQDEKDLEATGQRVEDRRFADWQARERQRLGISEPDPAAETAGERKTRKINSLARRASLMEGWAEGEAAAKELRALDAVNCSDCGTLNARGDICSHCHKDPRFNRVYRRS